MPALEIDSHGIQAVADVGRVLGELLSHAEHVKSTTAIEPALERADFGDFQSQILSVLPRTSPESRQTGRGRLWAILETAVRDIFGGLVAEASIESPAFVQVWNLLDLLSILSDSELCDPALLFWLVEELLDSQTISGCRKIFDYLESRRQRITTKYFDSKKLVILRTCNELLRRLSRARDTAFCGRVFIFLFQSFPLGDKSSVNLRGEFHVENITTYDQDAAARSSADQMDVDSGPKPSSTSNGKPPSSKPTDGKSTEMPIDADALYPIFWSLQASFSQPKSLFDQKNFAEFQSGLQSTLSALDHVQSQASFRSKQQDGGLRAGTKRKRGQEGADMADSFNPKYLTSRDLFELELSDLTFRRYILVQALIVMEFLLSLSADAKEKLAHVKVNNKSVTYSDQVLSDEEAKWASSMKEKITSQLTSSSVADGQYFHRIVATVLARDKNWVRWKIEGCPKIELPAVPPEQFAEAKKTIHRHVSKKYRSMAGSALSLDFLVHNSDSSALDSLRTEDRYRLPDVGAFKRNIAEDELEIDMPMNEESKAAAIEGKASKSWRALRIASRSRLSDFDKIDDPDKIGIVFEKKTAATLASKVGDDVPKGKQPADCRPLIISGPPAGGKSVLVKMLQERNPHVFCKVCIHTTKAPEGTVSDGEYVVVTASEFSTMLDSDRFLEHSTIGEEQFGTSRGAVDSVVEANRIPVMEMSSDGAQQTKDWSFDARHIFIKPPSIEVLEERLKDRGMTTETANELLQKAKGDIEKCDAEDAYDAVIENLEVEGAYAALEAFVYESKAAASENQSMGES